MEPVKAPAADRSRMRRTLWRFAAVMVYGGLVALALIRIWDDWQACFMLALGATVGLVVERQLNGRGYIGCAIGGAIGAALGDGNFSFSLLDELAQMHRGWSAAAAGAVGALLALPYAWLWRRLDPFWERVVAEKAQRGLQQGYVDSALAQYTFAIERQPNEATHYNNRGLAFLRLGRHAEALSDFSDALRINPRLAAALCNRALSFMQLGELDRAMEDLRQATELEPQSGAMHLQRGILLLHQGQDRQAIDAQAYYERAAASGRLKQFASAIEDLNRAVWIAPDYAAAFHLRGQTHAQQRNYTSAIQDFTTAIRLDPKRAEYYRSRAAAYEATSYFVESRADLERAEQLTPQVS